MRSVIIVFAKAPIPGHVKTRLTPPLTAIEAASLHEAFVRDTLAIAHTQNASVELHTDRNTDAWTDTNVAHKLQIPGDLGLKMFHALGTALSTHDSATIVGSDAPTIPQAHLTRLQDSDTDVAFGPAEDGGYYAVRATCVAAQMFDTIAWGTATALQESIDSCQAAGLTVSTGPKWFDIDEPADLQRLLKGDLPAHTEQWLRNARKDLIDSIQVGLNLRPVRGLRRKP